MAMPPALASAPIGRLDMILPKSCHANASPLARRRRPSSYSGEICSLRARGDVGACYCCGARAALRRARSSQ